MKFAFGAVTSLLLVLVAFGCGKSNVETEDGGRIEKIGSAPGGAAADKMLLDMIAKNGEDLRKPRKMEFFLYFSSESVAKAAAAEVAKLRIGKEKGFATSIEETDDNEWLVLTVAEMVINETVIAELRKQFERIVQARNGEYDGWTAEPSR